MQGIIVAPNGDVWAVDTMKGQVVHFPKGDPAKGELLCQNKSGNPFKNPCKLVAPFAPRDRPEGSHLDHQHRRRPRHPFSRLPTRPRCETFKTGFSGSGLAVDSSGNVWITNKLGSFEHGRLKLAEICWPREDQFR